MPDSDTYNRMAKRRPDTLIVRERAMSLAARFPSLYEDPLREGYDFGACGIKLAEAIKRGVTVY